MNAIAARAKVALDTVYAAVGRKPELFALLLETAISGTDEAVSAANREYVIAIGRARSAVDKLRIYSDAVGSIAPRLAPLYLALKAAAHAEPELGTLWKSISTRRAGNVRLFARDLLATGEMRADLTLDQVADIIWSMNGPEYYTLLVMERGWSDRDFTRWLYGAWCRLLLERALPRVVQ